MRGGASTAEIAGEGIDAGEIEGACDMLEVEVAGEDCAMVAKEGIDVGLGLDGFV